MSNAGGNRALLHPREQHDLHSGRQQAENIGLQIHAPNSPARYQGPAF